MAYRTLFCDASAHHIHNVNEINSSEDLFINQFSGSLIKSGITKEGFYAKKYLNTIIMHRYVVEIGFIVGYNGITLVRSGTKWG